MIKGWRNDPRWVAFYAQRDKDRAEREIEVSKMNRHAMHAQRLADSMARRNLSKPPEYAPWAGN